MKKIIAYTLPLLVLASCESYVENFEIEKHPPKTVLTAIISENDSLYMYVSESMHIDETNISNASLAETSSLKLFKNNIEYEGVKEFSKGKYVAIGLSPEAGNEFTIEAKSNKNPTAKASISIPSIPSFQLSNFELLNGVIDPTCFGCNEDYVSLTLNIENPRQTGYFSFEIFRESYVEMTCLRDTLLTDRWGEYWDCAEWEVIPTKEYTNFGVTSPLIEFYFDGYSYWSLSDAETGFYDFARIYFTNKNIHGNSITFNIKIPRYQIDSDTPMKAVLHTYDYSFFQHMKSYTSYQENNFDFLAEKVKIYSNIENGLGLFAVDFADTISFDVSEFVYEDNQGGYYY